MDRYYFTDTNGDNLFEIADTAITGVTGLGLAPVVLSQSSRGYNQDGTNVSNAKYDARPFSIALDIFDPASKEIESNIGAYFADNKPKTFWYQREGQTAKCLTPVYLNAAVDFDLSDVPVKSLVMSFLAPDPWFKIIQPFSSEIFDEAFLEFDLDIPVDGVELSISSADLVKTNSGSKPADTIIRFTGGADQPYIENLTTGEKLTVNRNIATTDILEINSATGRVDIIDANGVRHNAFNYIGDDDNFIHLAIGENILQFGVNSGVVGLMEVSAIEYFATI